MSVSVQPQLSLLEDLTRRQRLHLAAGFVYAGVLHGSHAGLGYQFAPLVQVDLNSRLYRARTSVVRSSVGAGTNWVADPVLGMGDAARNRPGECRCPDGFPLECRCPSRVRDRHLGSFRCGRRYPRRWDGRYGGHSPYGIAGPICSSRNSAEDLSERAPRLSSPDFNWHEREIWAFLSLYAATRVSWTTARSATNTIPM